MAVGIAPKLPLQRDELDGFYALTKGFVENTQQNLKHLVLTSPGEKIMDPEFGVGVRRILFENRDVVLSELPARIEEQVETYMPYINIVDIITEPGDGLTASEHALFLKIEYFIIPISQTNALSLAL
jgi:phage baseplate assembly protein W